MILKRSKRRWFAAICAALILLFAADYIAYPIFVRPDGPSENTGANGLWLSDRWYVRPVSEAEAADLAQKLKARQIRYAYIHVGSVNAGGQLRIRQSGNAIRLARTLHALAPGVQIVAWVYVGNERGRGRIDLSKPAVRATMANEAAWLVSQCGFDGIQWDYEICPSGDQGFLLLLEETRPSMPAGKLLSVATPMWLPAPFRHWGWSDGYFGEVAARCDQIDVMCYDSGLWWPRGYVWLVEQQATHVAQAAARANGHCQVLLGVPTYVSGGLSHDPHSENLRLALIGVRNGLGSSHSQPASFAGVAIFADYTTTPADWQTYSRLWPTVARSL